MRLTQKRNGKNVIPLLMAACGINLPYWSIDKADDLHSYLSGDAADKLAAYDDAEEQGLLVRLPCKIGTECWRVNFDRRRHPIEPVRFDIPFYYSFGKTIFLTREEAEAALKGEREDV